MGRPSPRVGAGISGISAGISGDGGIKVRGPDQGKKDVGLRNKGIED